MNLLLIAVVTFTLSDESAGFRGDRDRIQQSADRERASTRTVLPAVTSIFSSRGRLETWTVTMTT